MEGHDCCKNCCDNTKLEKNNLTTQWLIVFGSVELFIGRETAAWLKEPTNLTQNTVTVTFVGPCFVT